TFMGSLRCGGTTEILWRNLTNCEFIGHSRKRGFISLKGSYWKVLQQWGITFYIPFPITRVFVSEKVGCLYRSHKDLRMLIEIAKKGSRSCLGYTNHHKVR